MNDAAPSRSLLRFAPWLAALVVAVLLLARLWSFGIWDPSEIEIADQARRLAEGDQVTLTQWGPWLVSRGFGLFGMHEWSGRLPIALGGIAVALLSYALTRFFADARAGVYALVVAATSPLLVLNARTMLGEAPTLALQAAIVLCGALALYGSTGLKASGRLGWLVSCAILSVFAVGARGALLGALPALVALSGLALLDGRLSRQHGDGIGRVIAALLCAGTAVLVVIVTKHALSDGAEFDRWLGGQPAGGETPTFDAVFERIFHSFAPWSALLPLALAQLPKAPIGLADDDARRERRLRVLLLLWLGGGYLALSLYLSRYGRAAQTMPVPALAAAVALFMREVERAKISHWPAALGAALLASLLVRDYALYPESPLQALPLSEFKLPEEFDPSHWWIILLFGFGGLAVLALVADPIAPRAIDLRAPYRWLHKQWQRDLAYKLWLVALCSALVALLVLAVFSWFELTRMSTLSRQVGRVLGFIPLALPIAVAAVPVLLRVADALAKVRWLPLLLAGFVVGGYTAFSFVPGLSQHFSPREVYEVYNDLARSDEPLVEYRVGARTAAYYAKGKTIEVETLSALLNELGRSERRWLVCPADEFASIDRMFRTRSAGRHLFVADGRSAKVILATNKPIEGRKDENAIAEFVKREPPSKIQHPVAANFEDRVELLGYDLDLPQGDHVNPGDHFFVTWYFKVNKTVPGSYKIFVHIDENTMRIHGDHDPLDGRYPVRMWDVGDFIVDRQRIEVPATYPPADYTMYLGFYSGDARLDVKSGPMDDGDRVRAGVLRIR